MSEIAAATAHEAYAFACMRCGYGWEQAYEIEHHVDGSGNTFVVYKADGVRVPSPLSTPTCVNCEGHVVRIMRAGRVSTVQRLLLEQHAEHAGPDKSVAVAAVPAAGPPEHHWRLSDLMHPFSRR